MLSSTEIPKAILKINAVLGLSGIPMKPMMPAVINSGNTFGNSEIKIILIFANNTPIIMDIIINANSRLN